MSDLTAAERAALEALQTQLSYSEDGDNDDASWGDQTGVLISRNNARAILDRLTSPAATPPASAPCVRCGGTGVLLSDESSTDNGSVYDQCPNCAETMEQGLELKPRSTQDAYPRSGPETAPVSSPPSNIAALLAERSTHGVDENLNQPSLQTLALLDYTDRLAQALRESEERLADEKGGRDGAEALIKLQREQLTASEAERERLQRELEADGNVIAAADITTYRLRQEIERLTRLCALHEAEGVRQTVTIEHLQAALAHQADSLESYYQGRLATFEALATRAKAMSPQTVEYLNAAGWMETGAIITELKTLAPKEPA